MVDIDRSFGGKPFQKGLAYFEPVRETIEDVTLQARGRAKAILAEHRDTGDSFIEVEMADVDGHLILNDTRGDQAAYMIERETGALSKALGGSL